MCRAANVEFIPLAWETTGGAHEVVHATLRAWLKMAADRSSLPEIVLRHGFYNRLSIVLQQHNGRMVMNRLPAVGAPLWLFPVGPHRPQDGLEDPAGLPPPGGLEGPEVV